jgi:hypothetical protein
MASDPDQVSQVDSKHKTQYCSKPESLTHSSSHPESSTQSPKRTLAVSSQIPKSEHDTLYDKYVAKYTGTRPVQADFYNGPVTIGTDLPDDRIEPMPQEGLYDASNERVAYLGRDGETIQEKQTEGAERFEGRQAGCKSLVLVGGATHTEWIPGTENKDVRTCLGGWCVVVPGVVSSSQDLASSASDKKEVE